MLSKTTICPFCGVSIPCSNDTYSEYVIGFNGNFFNEYSPVNIEHLKCPNCSEIIINIYSECKKHNYEMMFYPKSLAKKFPEYVPIQVRNDYEEACLIKELSPKASATLSRRCLQGMIRDFHKINENSLFDEINSLKGKVDEELLTALHSMRGIGNIGAHPEHDINLIIDVDDQEAQQMIDIIELLMSEWYIARERRTKVLSEIKNTSNQKKAMKNNNQQ